MKRDLEPKCCWGHIMKLLQPNCVNGCWEALSCAKEHLADLCFYQDTLAGGNGTFCLQIFCKVKYDKRNATNQWINQYLMIFSLITSFSDMKALVMPFKKNTLLLLDSCLHSFKSMDKVISFSLGLKLQEKSLQPTLWLGFQYLTSIHAIGLN